MVEKSDEQRFYESLSPEIKERMKQGWDKDGNPTGFKKNKRSKE